MAKTTSQIVAENKRRRAKERETDYQRRQGSAGIRKEEAAASRQRSPASNSGKQTGRRLTYQEERNSGTGGSGESRYYLENQTLGSLAGDEGKAYVQGLKANRDAKRERSRLDSEEAYYLYQQLENSFPWKDNGDHLQEAREKRNNGGYEELEEQIRQSQLAFYGKYADRYASSYQNMDGRLSPSPKEESEEEWYSGYLDPDSPYYNSAKSFLERQGMEYGTPKAREYPATKAREATKERDDTEYHEDMEKVNRLVQEKERLDYVEKYTGKDYKNNFTKLLTGLGKYGINVGGESLEEMLQECVSIANLNHPGAGKWQLINDAAEILWDVISNPESEYREQVLGSAKEGGKLAMLLGGGEILPNTGLTNAVTNYQVNQIYGQDLQALIQEAQEINPNSALAKKLQESLDNGKKISGGDIKRLVLENEKAIANMDSSSVESGAEQQPNDAGSPRRNGWRNAADLARQEDLNAMDAMDRAGLSGSVDLARTNLQSYARSFQEAMKGGASYDQALMRATADAAMKVVGRQVPMNTLLYNIGGDPNKAVSVMGDALNRAGIRMTPGELNLLGIVAAEASAYQRDASFQTKVALEMLKGPKEEAWTAASETLWQEATDRVIEHGVADAISRDVGQGQPVQTVDTGTGTPASAELGETQNKANTKTNSGEPDETLTLKNAAGHEIIKVTKTDITGEPGSITQRTGKKGGIDRNYYGDDGRQYKQITNNDHGQPKKHPYGKHGEHAHDYIYDKTGKLIDRPARELTDLERKENEDIL